MKSKKENLSGQLNLFDSNMDFSVEEKEVLEEKSGKEPIEVHAKASKMHASLYRMYDEPNTRKKYVVAYIDYNKVYWKEEQKPPVLMLYPNAKMAVDAYMDKVHEYARRAVQAKEKLVLEDT